MHEFGRRVDTLGIMAPKTTERAALEEHGRPDTGSIMDRIALDIKNPP
jgi:hypothetical protein